MSKKEFDLNHNFNKENVIPETYSKPINFELSYSIIKEVIFSFT